MGWQHTYPLKRLQKLGHKNAINLSKTQKYKGDPHNIMYPSKDLKMTLHLNVLLFAQGKQQFQ
jgi:hypothetical protein